LPFSSKRRKIRFFFVTLKEIHLLGGGQYAIALQELCQFFTPISDIPEGGCVQDKAMQNHILEQLRNKAMKNRLILLSALRADKQVSILPEIIDHISSLRKIPIIIQINSVQDTVRTAVKGRIFHSSGSSIIIHLHPFFGIAHFDDTTIKKAWVLTGIDIFGRASKKEEEIQKIIRLFFKHIFQQSFLTEKGHHFHDISEGGAINKKHYSGSEIHDQVVAYTQAIPHMIRIQMREIYGDRNGEFFFQWIIKTMNANLDLSHSIINQNPYAKALYRGRIQSINNITDLWSTCRKILEHAENQWGEAYPFLSTPKYGILRNYLQQEDLS